jgi:hypothetical protein
MNRNFYQALHGQSSQHKNRTAKDRRFQKDNQKIAQANKLLNQLAVKFLEDNNQASARFWSTFMCQPLPVTGDGTVSLIPSIASTVV